MPTAVTKAAAKDAVNTMYWFRKALRLHDNPSLVRAVQGASTMHPVFCFDTTEPGASSFVRTGKVGVNRMKFLLETLDDLNNNLHSLDSRLIVLQGNPLEELPRAFKSWNIKRLALEVDTEPWTRKQEEEIRKIAEACGVEVVTEVGHTLADPKAIFKESGGKPITTFSTFCTLLDEHLKKNPLILADDVTGMPALSEEAKAEVAEKGYAVPSLSDLGYDADTAGCPFPGGETEALKRMRKYMARTKWIAEFEKPKTIPTEFGAERSTTILSPYLTNGCLSARVMYKELKAVYKKAGKHTAPPVSLEAQMLWREFYYAASFATPNYDQMIANPICRQIPWGEGPEAEARLEAWKEGKTGYPWIDACMVQLKKEGHLHHLARHAVACFLTRGDLWVSWEKGMEVFEERLIDADWALNAGNWMWLSCSCFFYQYFRCYSPVAFGKKYDPEGKFIKHYLPELKGMPSKFIFEPWKAPPLVQQKAKCIIGRDYPEPIVPHDTASKDNMGKLNAAYAAHKAAAAEKAGEEAAKVGEKRKSAGGGNAGSKVAKKK